MGEDNHKYVDHYFDQSSALFDAPDAYRKGTEIENQLLCSQCQVCPRAPGIDEVDYRVFPPCMQQALKQENEWNALCATSWFFRSAEKSPEWFACFFWRQRPNRTITWRQALHHYKRGLWDPQKYRMSCQSMIKTKMCPYATSSAKNRLLDCRADMFAQMGEIVGEFDIEDAHKRLPSLSLEWKHTPPTIFSSIVRLVHRYRA